MEKIYLVQKTELPRYLHKLYLRGSFGGVENFQMTIQFYTKDNTAVTQENYDTYLIEINNGILTNNPDRNYLEKDSKYLPILKWQLERESLIVEASENYGEEPEQYSSYSSLDWTFADSVMEVF